MKPVVMKAYWLGRVPYRKAWDLQRSAVAEIQAGRLGPTLLLLEHPAVFSLGRRADRAHLIWSPERCLEAGVEIVASDRGGDATYHGPGQLVAYPLVDLDSLNLDLWQYVHTLEAAVISYVATLGVGATFGPEGMAGVWVGNGKLAAVGIKTSKSITSHGLALNLDCDLDVFNGGIIPCGLAGRRATSLAELGAAVPPVDVAAHDLVPHLAAALQLEIDFAQPHDIWALPQAEPALETLPVHPQV